MERWLVLVALLAACSDPEPEAVGSDGGPGGATADAGVSGDAGADVPRRGAGDAGFAKPDGVADASADGSPDAAAPGCTDGALGCLDGSHTAVCAGGVWTLAADCGAGVCADGQCTWPGDCTPGAVSGCEGVGTALVCNAEGTATVATPCAPGEQCTASGCAPVTCTPGVAICAGSSAVQVCEPDGQGYGPATECPPSTACLAGKCLSLCEADIKYNTNVGCEYWSVDLDNDPIHNPALPNNPTPEMYPHSIVVTNPGTSEALVTFSVRVSCPDGSPCAPSIAACGPPESVCDTPSDVYDLVIADGAVPGGESREFEMPPMNVKGSSITPKAIRVVASRPVVVYQFNPFDSENAASNDGSLLLPRNGLGKLYFAVSLPSRAGIDDLQGNPWFPPNYGFLAVVAPEGTTTVQVTPTVPLLADPAQGVPQDGSTPAQLDPGTMYTFTLEPYDVLNLEHKPGGGIIAPGATPPDLTGTRIEADKKIAVFSGHQTAGIGEAIKLQFQDEWDSCCTEHLEEQLMPVEAWRSQALCIKSKPRGYERDRWVVVAGVDGVFLTTFPPIDGLDAKYLGKAGDKVTVETDESFVLKATGPIQVVQLLMSQGMTQPKNSGTLPTGDPTMMIVPPPEQYRDSYVIRTADGYGTNWTTIVRKAGTAIQVDGQPFAAPFEKVGDGTWEYAWREVTTGTHTFAGDEPFGLMVYGYGNVTAYGYPGGMSLEQP